MLPTSRLIKCNWLADIIYLGLGLVFFYLLFLGKYPLFTPDEGRYSEVAREMIAAHDYITPRVDGVAFLDKPILYYWLQVIALSLFGVKEWALRLFPALFGVFGCLVTYGCGRYLFDRRTGILSALLLASSPLYFGAAHYANLDLEVAVLISASLLFFITGAQRKENSAKFFLLAYGFAGLAFLTKGLIGIVFPLLIVGSWIVLLNRYTLLKKARIFSGIVLFLLLVLPWYILVQQQNPEFLHFFFVTQQVTRFLSSAEFNNKTPFWFYMPIVIVGLFPWSIFLFQALTLHIRQCIKNRFEHSTTLYLLLWVAVIFVFFSIPHSKIISYILPIFPALALLIGRYLSLQWERTQQVGIYFAIGNYVCASITITVLLILLKEKDWFYFSRAFIPYLDFIIYILIAGIAGFLILSRRKTLFALFSLGMLCNVLILLTLTLGAKHLNQNSARPLVTHLKTIIKPQDEVITYFKYYQDVPLYLGKLVTIATDWDSPDISQRDNWVRELWYGMPFQKTDNWLINENTFWQRFENNKRVFVFLNANYFQKFKDRAKSYFILGQYHDIILISNQL